MALYRIYMSFALAFMLVVSASGQKRLAVLIANQNYTKQSDLVSPINEVNEIRNVCEDNGYTVLSYENLSFNDFIQVFDTIESLIASHDFFYFHYSGHGIQIENQNYFVPVDVSPSSEPQLKRQCHGLSTLMDLIQYNDSPKNNGNLICLDACRSNPFEDLHIDVVPGLSEYRNLPTNTALIYSTTPGRTSLDGGEGLSPFAETWIKRIKQCENSIFDVFKLISGDILKKGIDIDRQPHFTYNGLSGMGFCNSFSSASINPNIKTLLNSLVSAAYLDKDLGYYELAISKIRWCDTILSRQTGIAVSYSSKLTLLKSECLIKNNEIQVAEKHLSNLWGGLVKSKFKNVEHKFIFDVYGSLQHCLKLLDKSMELRELRNEVLDYCDFNNLLIEKIYTIDKIAGDFERTNEWDSSLVYYSAAVKMIESLETNRKNAFNTFYVFANYGNALIVKGGLLKGIEELKKANEISLKYGFNQFWILEDIISFYTFDDYSFDSGLKYLQILDSLILRLNFNNPDVILEKDLLYHYLYHFNSDTTMYIKN
jgi:hypothetical protein